MSKRQRWSPKLEVTAADPLLAFAEREFDAVVIAHRTNAIPIQRIDDGDETQRLSRVLANYLDSVRILADEDQMAALQSSLCLSADAWRER